MTGQWRAYVELLRLPAVFTAIADVMMGYLVTHGSLQPHLLSGLLIAASASMYLAGMVLNDVFDVAVDTVERPHRPIPSGRISLRAAKRLGIGLLVSGLCLAFLAAKLSQHGMPAIVGAFLAAFVLLYDDVLKQTSIAPLVMGLCRFFNVLLGMSLAVTESGLPRHWTTDEWLIAAGIGAYVAGLTWISRREAQSPAAQAVVRNMLRAIIVIDAAIVLGFCGPAWSLAVIALLAPMLVLERWFDTT